MNWPTAAVLGYLIGSLPTADLLGRIRGVDLRSEGSGNPGTANALRTSGAGLAILVLVVEAAKGFIAVSVAGSFAGESGAVAAGLAAVAGNVYNVWYRFQGGKGLGISLGVLAGLWPMVLLPVLLVIAVGVVVTKSSGLASLTAVAALVVLALVWSANGWSTGGGLEPTSLLVVLSAGIALLIWRKHWRDSPLSSHGRR